ncbi:MAG TPA: RNA-binding S4 domain-containing protein [Bacteroidales bacterium]|jgi:ribosome-associated heat shock protein Hsp15|nr:RNA-binding S4 domain-containing protein [Bacteroidales bacterium]MDI9574013.1 RNA-binding S4 domain-containing protein [Bacteroidota bacterium]MBP9512336.1 RNA-binding S4 domain-containing protein [Bacteroidales bacterium]MBP9588963.1 RNA-binding S4 domain-containing protein [Bacteroidales bacterium]HOE59708.1 RNA-binding S4 domain-containing protein [Bacteroidales bacterium]
MSEEEIRIDKWLWAVRVFKTRSLASQACRSGKVRINGMVVKPSRDIRCGDVIQISLGSLNKTVEVKAILHNRISAKEVSTYLIDRTPVEEYERQMIIAEMKQEIRPKGKGRPTKRERRDIDRLKDSF